MGMPFSHLGDTFKSKQTYLSVPASGMGVTDNTVIRFNGNRINWFLVGAGAGTNID